MVSTFFDTSRSRIRVSCTGDGIVMLAGLSLSPDAEVISSNGAPSTYLLFPLLFGGLIERSREMSRGGWLSESSVPSIALSVDFEIVLPCASSWFLNSSLRRLCEVPSSISL